MFSSNINDTNLFRMKYKKIDSSFIMMRISPLYSIYSLSFESIKKVGKSNDTLPYSICFV